MTIPPAEGVRVSWDSVPASVRASIEQICGAPVVRATSQPGGFSPGVAARLLCADGTRWFVKAVSSDANPVTPVMHRREAQILLALDPLIAAGQLPVPRLRGTLEADPWIVLILDDVDGWHPRLPWHPDELAEVLSAVDRLADVLTPAPVDTDALARRFADDFTGWRTLAGAPDHSGIDPWSRSRLDELADLERTWPAHAAGDTLLHTDLRAENVLLTGDR